MFHNHADRSLAMTFKIFVCVWVFVGANIPSKSPPNGLNMSPSPFALTRERENAECGGWGKKIKNIVEYKKLKHMLSCSEERRIVLH